MPSNVYTVINDMAVSSFVVSVELFVDDFSVLASYMALLLVIYIGENIISIVVIVSFSLISLFDIEYLPICSHHFLYYRHYFVYSCNLWFYIHMSYFFSSNSNFFRYDVPYISIDITWMHKIVYWFCPSIMASIMKPIFLLITVGSKEIYLYHRFCVVGIRNLFLMIFMNHVQIRMVRQLCTSQLVVTISR